MSLAEKQAEQKQLAIAVASSIYHYKWIAASVGISEDALWLVVGVFFCCFWVWFVVCFFLFVVWVLPLEESKR